MSHYNDGPSMGEYEEGLGDPPAPAASRLPGGATTPEPVAWGVYDLRGELVGLAKTDEAARGNARVHGWVAVAPLYDEAALRAASQRVSGALSEKDANRLIDSYSETGFSVAREALMEALTGSPKSQEAPKR